MAGVTRTDRRNWLIYPALMGLGASLLASCAEKAPPPPPQQVELTPQPPPLPPPPPKRRVFPVPEHKPAAPGGEAAGPDSSDEALAMTGPEPAARPADTAVPPRANKLIGLDQPGATRLLGAATEKSEVPPATVWRYRTASCELDLYFYLDLRSGKMRTLHYAFKGDAADPTQQQECLRSLVVARAN